MEEFWQTADYDRRMGGIVVLVLASGRGERFVASGGKGSKLQAQLAGRPVLEHTLAAVRASGLRLHVEDAGHPGMGDSIAAGVRATADADGWLVLPPRVPKTLSDESLEQTGWRSGITLSTPRSPLREQGFQWGEAIGVEDKYLQRLFPGGTHSYSLWSHDSHVRL